jgi:chorismate mutase
LANHAEQQATKFDAFDLRAIAELYALEFTPGWIEGASEVFEKREWAKIKRFSESEEGGIISAALTGPGLLEAERLRGVLQDQGVDGRSYVPSEAASVTNAPALSMSTDQEANSTQTARNAGRVRSDAWGGAWGRAWGSGVPGSAANPIPIPAADRFVTRADNVLLFEKAEQELEALIEAVRASNDLKVTADERLAIVSEVAGIRSLLKQPAVRVRAIYDAIRENSVLKWLAIAAGAGVVGDKAVAAVNALLALVGL